MRDFAYWAKNVDDIRSMGSTDVLVESLDESFRNPDIIDEYAGRFASHFRTDQAGRPKMDISVDSEVLRKINADLDSLDPESAVFTGYNAGIGLRNCIDVLEESNESAVIVNGKEHSNPAKAIIQYLDEELDHIDDLSADGMRAGLYAAEQTF